MKWTHVSEKTPSAYETGKWDGLRSEFVLACTKSQDYYVARVYKGILDGSEFCEFVDSMDYTIENVEWWTEIENPLLSRIAKK